MFAINSGTLAASGTGAITAAGSTQGGATIQAWINLVPPPSGSTGVRLLNGTTPMIQRIVNTGANTLSVYRRRAVRSTHLVQMWRLPWS